MFSNDQSRPAGLPSLNPTRSFWTHSSPDANPLAREGSTGPLTTDADVCIIGSGITGIGVAYHLSEAIEILNTGLDSPIKVVVLEARDFCSGATGRNGGHLSAASFSGLHARVFEYGREEAKRSHALKAHTTSSLLDIIDTHGWADEIDLVRGGRVDLLFSDDEVDSSRRDRDAAVDAGLSLEGIAMLSREEVEAAFGAHYSAIKIPACNLWPVKLVTKLYQLARSRMGPRLDLTLHTHTPVTAIEPTKASSAVSLSKNVTRAYSLSTPRGTIACSRIIHATNAYASHLLPILAGEHGIVPVRGQVIATRASVGIDEIKANAWTANKGFEYWFPRPIKMDDERPLVILGGARDVTRPALEAYVDDDTTCHPLVGKTLRAFLPGVFEGKFELGRAPEMEWTGIMGYTATGDPFVGPVDKLAATRGIDPTPYAGQYIAAGYTGNGMPRAFGCAKAVAQMVLEEWAGKGWSQPEWLPTQCLTWAKRGTTARN